MAVGVTGLGRSGIRGAGPSSRDGLRRDEDAEGLLGRERARRRRPGGFFAGDRGVAVFAIWALFMGPAVACTFYEPAHVAKAGLLMNPGLSLTLGETQ